MSQECPKASSICDLKPIEAVASFWILPLYGLLSPETDRSVAARFEDGTSKPGSATVGEMTEHETRNAIEAFLLLNLQTLLDYARYEEDGQPAPVFGWPL